MPVVTPQGIEVPTQDEFNALKAEVIWLANEVEALDARVTALEQGGGGEIIPPDPVPPIPPEYDAVIEGPSADGNNTSEINTVLADVASRGGGTVYLSPGVYPHDGLIEVAGVTLVGAGDSSELLSTNQDTDGWPTLAVHLSGSAPGLKNLKVTTTWGTERGTTPYAQAVWVDRADRFLVQGVHVVGAAAGGIYCETSTNGVVEECVVEDTNADGIGIGYSGSSHNIARRNTVRNTGDDNISICSYQSYDQSTGNLIEDNVCDGSWYARGIVDLGGRDTIIRRNAVSNARCAGIFTIRDDLCDTYECVNCTVEDNQVDNCVSADSGYVANFQFCQDTQQATVTNNTSSNPGREHWSVGSGCSGQQSGNEPAPSATVSEFQRSHDVDPKRFMRPKPVMPPKPPGK